ncbi:MAG: YncE family protein, partial [Saprospiraceae bacterium]
QVFTFNHNGNSATVIDAASNKVLATIPLAGSPEFAVSDGQGKIYVNIEDKNSLAVIEAKSGKVLQTWSLSPGEEPSGLAFDVKNQRLFAVCSNHKMVVVDAKTGKVVQSMAIGDGPDGVVFDPGTRRIYSSNGDGTLTVIEEMTPDKYRVVTNVPTQKGARTIALDPITHCLYLPTADREAAVGNARPGIKAGSFVVLEVSTQ